MARARACAVHRLRDACSTSSSASRAKPDFFASDEETYATGLMFLAERFHFLLDAADDLGLIVVDSRFREDDARLRRFFADLTHDGTPVLSTRPDRRGPLPRSVALLDRPAMRRPRRRDHGGRRAGQRPRARLFAPPGAALRDAPAHRSARRGRPEALPGRRPSPARGDEALLSVDDERDEEELADEPAEGALDPDEVPPWLEPSATMARTSRSISRLRRSSASRRVRPRAGL